MNEGMGATSGVFAERFRKVPITRLDKVLYPETGTTKGDVIQYFQDIAVPMLTHLGGRIITRKRWPNGVDKEFFYEKNLPAHAPEWIARRTLQHSSRVIEYPVADCAATLVWFGQQAALELHVPQWLVSDHSDSDFDDDAKSDRLIFDLDPGPGVTVDDMVPVAVAIRQMTGSMGVESYPLTSGSKGIHVYGKLPRVVSGKGARTLAAQIAVELEKQFPTFVTAVMSQDKRDGKVFVDWSQNHEAKTTIAPYSLRGVAAPFVAAPRTWAELEVGGLRQLRYDEVVDRYRRDGDLLAGLAGGAPAGEGELA